MFKEVLKCAELGSWFEHYLAGPLKDRYVYNDPSKDLQIVAEPNSEAEAEAVRLFVVHHNEVYIP